MTFKFWKLLWTADEKQFSLGLFKAKRFADIQLDIELKAFESADVASLKFSGLNEIYRKAVKLIVISK